LFAVFPPLPPPPTRITQILEIPAGIVIVPDDVIVCRNVIPALGAGNTEIAIS
jgi:hypothetical protein